ncbi:hypothetical protein A6V27_19605 [Hafnia alvei]|uniref:phage late control D family protein n=1 Tax=Hafnia alvei TaxID=569 RepID=UPI0007BCCE84|nr:phage late control D family protein [Hafnia alvei]ANC42419.1 hypothetical protein A6V27_19605 [Hafnia alvei]
MITDNAVAIGADLAPAFMLTLSGRNITENISPRLIAMMMTDNRGFEADQLDITLDDSDGFLALPVRGAVLELFLGWKGSALIGKGQFTVDEIEYTGAPDTMTIRARSADFRGTMNTSREESYHDTTLGAVIEIIAKRNKLKANLAKVFANIAVQHIDQSQESDSQFLVRLAKRNGAEVSVKNGELLFLKPGSNLTASGQPIPIATVERADGDKHQFSITDRLAYSGVVARWLDTDSAKQAKQKVKLQRKSEPSTKSSPSHPNAKVSADHSIQPAGSEYLVGDVNNVLVLPTIYAAKEQAMQAAQAEWDQQQRLVAKFTINLARGNPLLYPEMPLRVRGFKSIIDQQEWTIVKLEHSLTHDGFTTKLSLEIKLSDVKYEETDSKTSP